MKKKVVLTISILLLICVVATSFSGCLFFHVSRHKKLKLAQVYQTTDGDLYFDIANEDVIEDLDDLEFTFDGGNTWQKASGWKGNYSYKVKESDYGKEYKIAVRIAWDFDKREGKKSNTVNYVVKQPYAMNEYIEDFWATVDDTYTPEEGYYKFVVENGVTRLKRYAKEGDGSIVLKDVDKDDRIDIEFKFLDKKDIDKEWEQSAKDIFEGEDIRKYIKDESQLPDLIEMLCVFRLYEETSGKRHDVVGWRDYNHDEGISNDEYAQGIIAGFDYDDKSIFRVGELFFMLVRIKENDTTLRSETLIIKCWI